MWVSTAMAGSAISPCRLLSSSASCLLSSPFPLRSSEASAMDLVRDVLDCQLLDRNGVQVGRADGLVILVRKGRPPELAFIETGGLCLARRLHPRIGAWAAGLWKRLGRRPEPNRLPWQKVTDVGLDIEIDIDAAKEGAAGLQEW